MSKKDLFDDLNHILHLVNQRGYLFTPTDCFAMGYLAGKYNLRRLISDRHKLKKACDEYDKKDDLGLSDTISAVFVDLGILPNENNTD